MDGHRSRLPLAILGAALAAGAATFLLRPRGALIEPAAVKPTAYFSAAELRRAEDFRSGQRLLALGGLAVSGGVLLILTTRPPRRLLDRLARRPILGAAGAGAGIALVLVVAALPLAAVAQRRAVHVGLSTQSWGAWLSDVGKSTALNAVFAAAGGALLLALVRRFPRRWWAPAAVCVLGVGILTTWLFPVLVDPIFNRFEPLPRGRLRSEVLQLASRAGVAVGQVYRVDASRRTTGTNAYVNGLGRTKRVVLYDTLIDRFPPDQIRSVVAHELGHQKHHDIQRGLLWLAIVAPAGTFLTQALAERIGRSQGLGSGGRPGPAALPALALSLALVSFALGSVSNDLSRRIESSADDFALRETHDPAAFIGLERRLALTNVVDPDPPRFLQILFGTHPTTMQRIGAGVAFERSQRPR
jgi:STE24 endopeptidase